MPIERAGLRAASALSRSSQGLGATRSADLPGARRTPEKLDVESYARKSVTGAKIVAVVPLGMPASGIVHLASGEILAVSDNSGVCEVRPGEKPRLLFKVKDGEGITADPKGKYVYVVEEAKRRVRKLEVRRDDKGRVALRDTDESRTLPKLKSAANTGWEGASFWPKGLAGNTKDRLVCAHEGSPRRIGIYALPDLDDGQTLRIPDDAKHLLPDLADVAVCPKTGHLFVVSDQSRTVAEFVVEDGELKMLSSIELPLSGQQKPEGLFFDSHGRLWIALDNENDDKKSGEALVLELKRA